MKPTPYEQRLLRQLKAVTIESLSWWLWTRRDPLRGEPPRDKPNHGYRLPARAVLDPIARRRGVDPDAFWKAAVVWRKQDPRRRWRWRAGLDSSEKPTEDTTPS